MSEHALVIGEALIDAVRRADGTVTEHPGGSPANVALGLARLGRDTELLTWIGADAHGTAIHEHLARSGVALAAGSADASATSVATATLDEAGAAAYHFDLTWDLSGAAAPRPAPIVVHTGSIAAVLAPGAAGVLAAMTAAREHATITYDPNARPTLMGDPATALVHIEAAVAVADVVKASDEDVAWLTQATGGSAEALIRRWAMMGPAFVVVTRGAEGASALTHDGREVHVPAPAVTVVDTVGAGDSFMSGVIDGLWSAGLLGASRRKALRDIDDEAIAAVLHRCARIGAITVSRAGANPPTAEELEALPFTPHG